MALRIRKQGHEEVSDGPESVSLRATKRKTKHSEMRMATVFHRQKSTAPAKLDIFSGLTVIKPSSFSLALHPQHAGHLSGHSPRQLQQLQARYISVRERPNLSWLPLQITRLPPWSELDPTPTLQSILGPRKEANVRIHICKLPC